jgi:hypothetical protein
MSKPVFASKGDFSFEESLSLLHLSEDIGDYSKIGLSKILEGEYTMNGETRPILVGYSIVNKELWESVKHEYGF